MFINENTANVFYNEATADASYMYDAILEANDAYHDLCMRMIKCEHAAIVNEDTAMLAEAEGSFMERIKKIASTLLAKFIAFIDRVKAEWSKLWSGILSKFVKLDDVTDYADLGKANIKVEANIKGIIGAEALFNKVHAVSGSNIRVQLAQIKEILGKEKDQKDNVTVKREQVQAAVKFIEKRPEWIRDLEDMKKVAKNAYEKDIKESNGNADSLMVAQYSSVVSKTIVRINSFTADAVKICRAAIKNSQGDKNYKAAKANVDANRAADKADAKRIAQNRKDAEKAFGGKAESVLDLFG